MAEFFNKKSLIIFTLIGFILLKLYLNNDILQTDIDILLKKTINLQKDFTRLNTEIENLKEQLNKASFSNTNDQPNSAPNKEASNSNLFNLVVTDLIIKIDTFLKLNDSNPTTLARLLRSSLMLKNEQEIKENKLLPNVKLFDLMQPLEPASVYEKIQCKQSSKFIVKTILCIHDLNRDAVISKFIWDEGSFEKPTLKRFTDYLAENPDWLVIDLGSHIGQYALFAAKMGHDVISVEPFYDSLLRIHKASVLEHTNTKIKLIHNAISNRRREVKVLNYNPTNIGAQTILEEKDPFKFKFEIPANEREKYTVETILLDDIIDYIPKNRDNRKYEKAIIKIDIEGLEALAFQNARKLFHTVQVQLIFMEWKLLPQQIESYNIIIQMIEFFYSFNLQPYINDTLLEKDSWKFWPHDIVWKRDNLV